MFMNEFKTKPVGCWRRLFGGVHGGCGAKDAKTMAPGFPILGPKHLQSLSKKLKAACLLTKNLCLGSVKNAVSCFAHL